MIDLGRHNLLGVNISAVDYESAVASIIAAAKSRAPFGVSALAVHGVMTGWFDDAHRRRLNGLQLVVPDGQPVRWALRWLYGKTLPDRVYGPRLTLLTLEAAAREGLPIYFYGSTEDTLSGLVKKVQSRFPDLKVAGTHPSLFRPATPDENADIRKEIIESGAAIVFCGLGCPRQEVWAFEEAPALSVPILAVGAAFPFLGEHLRMAPNFMQNAGLEWLFRLCMEPKRLWRRYLLLNPLYLALVFLQLVKLYVPAAPQPNGAEPVIRYG